MTRHDFSYKSYKKGNAVCSVSPSSLLRLTFAGLELGMSANAKAGRGLLHRPRKRSAVGM